VQLSKVGATPNAVLEKGTRAIGVAILRTVLFPFSHDAFGLLPVNGHDTNRTSAEIDFRVTKSKAKKGGFVKCTVCKIVSPQRAAWLPCALAGTRAPLDYCQLMVTILTERQQKLISV
jgi:hypothetical protein